MTPWYGVLFIKSYARRYFLRDFSRTENYGLAS